MYIGVVVSVFIIFFIGVLFLFNMLLFYMFIYVDVKFEIERIFINFLFLFIIGRDLL